MRIYLGIALSLLCSLYPACPSTDVSASTMTGGYPAMPTTMVIGDSYSHRASAGSDRYGGGPAFREVHELINGDLSVNDAVKFFGRVNGTVTVEAGGDFLLYGLATQDVIVSEGGTAFTAGLVNGNVCNRGGGLTIIGVINGNVYNRGGDLNVYGTIDGFVFEEGGSTHIDPQAVVKGGVRYSGDAPRPTETPRFDDACFG